MNKLDKDKKKKKFKLSDIDLSFISLVDNPAVPDATFRVVKNDEQGEDMNLEDIQNGVASITATLESLYEKVENQGNEIISLKTMLTSKEDESEDESEEVNEVYEDVKTDDVSIDVDEITALESEIDTAYQDGVISFDEYESSLNELAEIL